MIKIKLKKTTIPLSPLIVGLEHWFEPYNNKLDAFLIQHGLLKIKPHPFEKCLPYFIQEILLNIHSGSSLEKALKTSINANEANVNFTSLSKRTQHQGSAITALSLFAIECNSQEIWKLTRLINQNYLTGSSSTYYALEKFHDELWQNKLTKAKMQSEKVGVMLTFLLTLSLISVIMVVITPIMINMKL